MSDRSNGGQEPVEFFKFPSLVKPAGLQSTENLAFRDRMNED